MVIGAALVGAVLSGVLIWDWNRTPSTSGLRLAASGDSPKANLRLLSPGILSIAIESGNTYAAGLALQGDGTIVVGATMWSPASDKERGVVLRLTSNGRLANPALTLLADTPTIVSDVSTAGDGTIVVIGYGSSTAVTNRHFLLARLRPDGALDPAFGGGVVLANMRSSMWLGEAARAVALQRDDRLVAAGTAGYATGPLSQASYCATARFSRDGRFDRSFGDNGRVLTLVAGKQSSCAGTSVLVALDGKIVVAGDYGSEGERRHIALLRYLPDGTLDRGFGRAGIAQLLPVSANARGAALDSQGRIIVVGTEWLSLSTTRFLVVRYDTDGNLDQSFNATGIVSLHAANVSQELSATALEQEGNIVAVGTFGWHSRGRPPEPGKRDQIAALRLDPSGALDKSFAGGGLLLMTSPRYLWGARRIAVQSDGKLLIAGYVNDEANDRATSSIVLVRLNPDGTPDADFGNGVDRP